MIHQKVESSPIVVVDVWVKAGAKEEPEAWLGMAHFLEHMIFKGSKNIKPGEFDYQVEKTGGITNAATSHDYAHFFLSTRALDLPETLPYFAEILLEAEIDPEEFHYERNVVIEEIYSAYDDPDWIGFQSLCENIYQKHPYRRSILGEEAILKQHTPNQMRCFHKSYYQPENMTVVIVGGIEAKEALKLVNDCFVNFSIRSECPPKSIEAEPPLIGIRRNEIYLPRIQQARLSIGWIGPSIQEWEEALVIDLISVIIAGARYSRLRKKLQEEKQIVLDISSDYSIQQDSSLLTIDALLKPENVAKVEEAIAQEIELLQNDLVSEIEINLAKKLLINDYIFSTETPGQLAGLYGYYQTVANTAKLSIAYPSTISRITPKDIQKVAQQYLSSQHYAITVLYPV